MPKQNDASGRKGPPKDVITHLIDVHKANGTLDEILQSGIGDLVSGQLNTQFAAFAGQSSPFGIEPWVFDGVKLTMLADINPGIARSFPAGFTIFEDALYFAATNETDRELYMVASGSTAPVEIDINPTGSSNPAGFMVFDNALYFAAFEGTDRELYRLDAGSTVPVEIEINTTGSSDPDKFAVFDNALFFQAFDGTDRELYRLDAGSTVPVEIDINPTGSAFPELFSVTDTTFTVFDNALYFSADDGTGFELHKLEAGSTTPVKIDINPTGGSLPDWLTVFDNALYFRASDDTDTELYRLDAGSTVPVEIDIDPTGSSNPGSIPGVAKIFDESFAVFDSALYFEAGESQTFPDRELYKLEAGSTVAVEIDINPTGSSNPQGFLVFNDALYFRASNGTDTELYKLDAGSTVPIEIDFLASGSSNATPIAVVNDTLMIGALLDTDDNPIYDRSGLLVAKGSPTSAGDFVLIDDESGTFDTNGNLVVLESDQLFF